MVMAGADTDGNKAMSAKERGRINLYYSEKRVQECNDRSGMEAATCFGQLILIHGGRRESFGYRT